MPPAKIAAPGGVLPGANVTATRNEELRYEEGGARLKHELRLKPGNKSKIHMQGKTCYIAVVIYSKCDGSYQLAIPPRLVPNATTFNIRDDHLVSDIPFTKFDSKPDFSDIT